MSDLNEIIAEMSNNITEVLSNSVKKILQREEMTKNCLLNMPQINDIVKTNEFLKKYVEKIEIEKDMLKKENLKLQKILECYGEKFNTTHEEKANNIKNISLDVSEKNNDLCQVNMDVIKESKNLNDKNKVIKLANLWQYENIDLDSSL